MDRQDLIYALEKMKRYLEEVDDSDIKDILLGVSLNTAMIPPNWSRNYEDLERRIIRLELRVR